MNSVEAVSGKGLVLSIDYRLQAHMMEAMQGVAGLERIGEPEDWAFDAQGNLW